MLRRPSKRSVPACGHSQIHVREPRHTGITLVAQNAATATERMRPTGVFPPRDGMWHQHALQPLRPGVGNEGVRVNGTQSSARNEPKSHAWKGWRVRIEQLHHCFQVFDDVR